MSTVRRCAALGVVAATLMLGASEARAYCRTTTCDPERRECTRDAKGCAVAGTPLYWASECVSFVVHQAGSARHGIDATLFASEVSAAFQRWLEVDCGGGRTPKLTVQNLGPVECGRVEYNQRGGNANIFMFRDEEWPYVGGEDALGLTTIRFDPKSGRIYDVDVEINGASGIPISVGKPREGAADLASILTHEVGHFLGLSHTVAENATMRPAYEIGRDLTKLGDDDRAGICEALAPDRVTETQSCAPRHGFSSRCGGTKGGCSVARPGAGSGSELALGALAIALGAARARRRARRDAEPTRSAGIAGRPSSRAVRRTAD
ncbi:MAG: matrixin family metalloprotease [Pseudomonadota bacterium]|nr:MAG: hypothetical protein DIU78_02280 [Pseudomonadota bacterium]